MNQEDATSTFSAKGHFFRDSFMGPKSQDDKMEVDMKDFGGFNFIGFRRNVGLELIPAISDTLCFLKSYILLTAEPRNILYCRSPETTADG
ncbi:hypothetical protein TNCV_3110901 [Trichonephila clavipes]|nr:hypothetical protein TNCV_3110901 [Trichonephila clavipes]